MFHLILIISLFNSAGVVDTKQYYPTMEACKAAADQAEPSMPREFRGNLNESMTIFTNDPTKWGYPRGMSFDAVGYCIPSN